MSVAIPVTAPTRATLTPAEVATILGVSQNELYPRLRRGEMAFPVVRVGRRWLIPARPFYAWLDGAADPDQSEPE